jgi:uncharacterized small protein (DUF1192 family)
MKKPSVISSGVDHQITLSHDQRVAARSHLGKRESTGPVDRISSGDFREGVGKNNATLLSSSELESRIKLLGEVTESLQAELRAVQNSKAELKSAKGLAQEQLDAKVQSLAKENQSLQSELEALQKRSQEQSQERTQPSDASQLKKKQVLPIPSLSDAGTSEKDLEKRMRHIRQVTQSLRIELESLVKSSEQKG